MAPHVCFAQGTVGLLPLVTLRQLGYVKAVSFPFQSFDLQGKIQCWIQQLVLCLILLPKHGTAALLSDIAYIKITIKQIHLHDARDT